MTVYSFLLLHSVTYAVSGTAEWLSLLLSISQSQELVDVIDHGCQVLCHGSAAAWTYRIMTRMRSVVATQAL